MKASILRLFALLILVLPLSVAAKVAGTWEGTLTVAPGNEIVVQFIIEEKDDGSLSVVLNSPESRAIKNVAADSASFTDDTLKVEVATLSGTYEGTLASDTISGKWTQVGQSFDLNLTPFAEKVLDTEAVAAIVGRWPGVFEPPGQKVNVILNVEETDPGKLRAFLTINSQRSPLPNFKFDGSEISFNVGPGGPKYTGTVTGTDIKGFISAGATTFPGNLIKKEFNPRDYALNLDEEGQNLLMGQWYGEMTTPVGPVAAVFRFETEDDYIRGYFDSPDRGAIGIPITEVDVQSGTVSFSVENGSTFTGSVAASNIEGEYSQQGQKLPVTLSKGTSPPLALDIPSNTQPQLLGNWQGKLKTPQGIELNVGIRFEKEVDGSVVGYLDSPDQGIQGARIRFASFEEDKLTVRSNLLRLEYNGTLENNQLTGQMSLSGQNIDLNLAKVE